MSTRPINPLAVLVAAIAVYAAGFIIYGMLVPGETWAKMSGLDMAELKAIGMSRMPYSVIMPLVTAICLAIVLHWRGAANWREGAQTGFVVALGSALMARLYGWVYGVGGIDIIALDWVHLLLGHVLAGAILGGWPHKASAPSRP
jgi:glucan phosphoethanolaminetransferase (alkaline phosphatase superfamily)